MMYFVLNWRQSWNNLNLQLAKLKFQHVKIFLNWNKTKGEREREKYLQISVFLLHYFYVQNDTVPSSKRLFFQSIMGITVAILAYKEKTWMEFHATSRVRFPWYGDDLSADSRILVFRFSPIQN